MRLLLILAVGLAVALCAGCGQPTKRSLWERYDEPGGAYRVYYLRPPWKRIAADGSALELRVDNNPSAFGIDSGLAPKYALFVSVVAGDPAALAAREARRAPGRSETVLFPPSAVRTEAGDSGFGLTVRQDGGEHLYRRFAFLADRGVVVQLLFEAVPVVDDPEIDAMLGMVDVAPGAP